ncbi:hypothetical protein [Streptomyces justiciae]|uniref:hypothetical protein n=1 Tax=Streptomyces justiciae TaxID=2780140 RepID=UPI0021187A2D|nr:hypothetical protein [Streptomyces justiciae]MCW8383134.1 hypothetical protein [Streptomyces justiciae]
MPVLEVVRVPGAVGAREGRAAPAPPGRPGFAAGPVTVSAFAVREDLVRDVPDPKLR